MKSDALLCPVTVTFTLKDRVVLWSRVSYGRAIPDTLMLTCKLYLLCFEKHVFAPNGKKMSCYWVINKRGCSAKATWLPTHPPTHRQPSPPPPLPTVRLFARCVACLQACTTSPETHKKEKQEALKYLNLAKINKLKYSLHILLAAHRIQFLFSRCLLMNLYSQEKNKVQLQLPMTHFNRGTRKL